MAPDQRCEAAEAAGTGVGEVKMNDVSIMLLCLILPAAWVFFKA